MGNIWLYLLRDKCRQMLKKISFLFCFVSQKHLWFHHFFFYDFFFFPLKFLWPLPNTPVLGGLEVSGMAGGVCDDVTLDCCTHGFLQGRLISLGELKSLCGRMGSLACWQTGSSSCSLDRRGVTECCRGLTGRCLSLKDLKLRSVQGESYADCLSLFSLHPCYWAEVVSLNTFANISPLSSSLFSSFLM